MLRLLTLALACAQDPAAEPAPAWLTSGVTILVPSRPAKSDEKKEEKKEETPPKDEKKTAEPEKPSDSSDYQPPWMGQAVQSPDASFAAFPALCLDADSAPPARLLGTAYSLQETLGTLGTDETKPYPAEPGAITATRVEDLRLRDAAATIDVFTAIREKKVEAGIALTGALRVWIVLRNLTDRPLLVVVPRGSVVEFETRKAKIRAPRDGDREKAALRAFDAFAKLAAEPPRAWKESHPTFPDELRLPLEHWYFWIATQQRTLDDLRATLLAEARSAGVPTERRAAVVGEITAKAAVAYQAFSEAYR